MLDVRGDLEALVAETHRRAEQRALEREATAERRAAETVDEARGAAEATLAQQRERTDEEAAEVRRRVLALGEMRVKRASLEHREALLASVWERARARLAELVGDAERYAPTLRRLAGLAARAVAESEIVLTSDPRGHALLTPERLEAWGREDGVRYLLAPEPGAMLGGLVASAGRLHVDASFDTRLEVASQELRETIVRRLLASDVGIDAPSEPEREGS
ncbi:MAG: V-type ATP synthase subunit E family protein [Deinococcales bacterium]